MTQVVNAAKLLDFFDHPNYFIGFDPNDKRQKKLKLLVLSNRTHPSAAVMYVSATGEVGRIIGGVAPSGSQRVGRIFGSMDRYGIVRFALFGVSRKKYKWYREDVLLDRLNKYYAGSRPKPETKPTGSALPLNLRSVGERVVPLVKAPSGLFSGLPVDFGGYYLTLGKDPKRNQPAIQVWSAKIGKGSNFRVVGDRLIEKTKETDLTTGIPVRRLSGTLVKTRVRSYRVFTLTYNPAFILTYNGRARTLRYEENDLLNYYQSCLIGEQKAAEVVIQRHEKPEAKPDPGAEVLGSFVLATVLEGDKLAFGSSPKRHFTLADAEKEASRVTATAKRKIAVLKVVSTVETSAEQWHRTA